LVLAALCGLRRGEITALRWKAVDLDSGQLAVVASTEQTDKGAIREKEGAIEPFKDGQRPYFQSPHPRFLGEVS
jgi:integrase